MKPMKPLLAATIDDEATLNFPVMTSPKLDGIRAMVIDGILVSRNFKPIPNAYVQSILSHVRFNGLDGELIVGPETDEKVFQRTTSGVMSRDDTPGEHLGTSGFVFRVFDDFTHPAKPFNERYRAVVARVSKMPAKDQKHIQFVWHTHVNDVEELRAQEEKALICGYEGLMVRSLHGPYKFGRSSLKEGTLLKLKRFSDDEAVILSMDEQMQNNNEKVKDALGHSKRSSHKANLTGKGTLGALQVRNTAGQEFSIGTGFDDELKAWFWKNKKTVIGRTIKYKYQKVGMKDLPRFPVYLGFREDI